MALTLNDAIRRSGSKLMRGLAKEIVTTDELANVIPIRVYPGDSISYMREGTLPGTGFIGDDGVIDDVSTGVDDKVTVPARRVVSDLDVDALAEDISMGSETTRQIAKKTKATWRLVKDKLINGAHTTGHTLLSSADPFAAITGVSYGPWLDSARNGAGRIKYTNTGTTWQFQAPGDRDFGDPVTAAADGTFTVRSFNRSKYIVITLDVSLATADGTTDIAFTSTDDEFDGLIRLCSADQVIPSVGTDGDAFSLDLLDEMISAEKIRQNRSFFWNSKMTLRFLAAFRALGGTDPEHTRLPGYSGSTMTYRGIPILESDNCLLNETVGSTTDASSLWLASLDADEGLFLGAAGTGSPQDVEGDPLDRVVMGFRIEQVGPIEGKDHRRTRVKWYGSPGLRSSLALVRRQGVQSTA